MQTREILTSDKKMFTMVHFRVTECTVLAVAVLREYLYLYIWELAYGLILQRGVVDQYRWKLITSGECNSKSA